MLTEMQRNIQEQWDEMQRKMQEQWDEVRREITDARKVITEVKQTLEGFISRMDKMQEAIEGIETREQERIEADIERDKRISRNETILRELCDQSKRNNIHIIGVPEEEDRGKGIESVFEEIIAENFPTLGEEIIEQTTEIHRTPNRKDPRRRTPRHIIIKMAKIKDKERVLKAAREKKVTYKGKPIRLSSDFSTETLQARREWHDIFNTMKQKGLEPRILYPARLSFKYDGGIKQFQDKQKLREFASHKPPLQGILQGLLYMGALLKRAQKKTHNI
ncbi:LINE-1 type transposase domain-containing protein 1 isoform X2 [Manis pentadactyla]|uniref:LINE-1 type transposase domain-containing protein 1 isoform X2 n=1 Tax=Manis pentadactyla TaxID=143292 RepID=UPI00255C7FE7|nr:LINE-1 type transposase domain-containing protein 1 isoform X2 [Manis pentadactyla]